MESHEDRSLVSVYRAARELRLAPSRLREAVNAGELPAVKPGTRTTYVRWSDVEDWLRACRASPNEVQSAS